MTQITNSETSAKATTSARRITGGSSALLSGTGVPSGALDFGRSPEAALRSLLLGGALRSSGKGLVDERSPGSTRTMVLPRARR